MHRGALDEGMDEVDHDTGRGDREGLQDGRSTLGAARQPAERLDALDRWESHAVCGAGEILELVRNQYGY